MNNLLLLIAVVVFLTQQPVQLEEPDLLVTKFEWVREKQSSRMIRGAQDPGRQTTVPSAEIQNQSLRKEELRRMEKNAARSVERPFEDYHISLDLRNAGSNVVKGFIWEFQPTVVTEGYQPKQYLCALEVKPNEKNKLDVWTPFLPVKVLNAKEGKSALEDGKVVINKIEYVDGSVWKKSGWDFRLPSDSLKKLAEGTCSVF